MITCRLGSLKLIKILDPSNLLYTNVYRYIENLTRRLVCLDESGLMKNYLAENVNYDEKKLELSIELKPDQKFSDGSPITSDDIAQTFKRLIYKSSAHTDPEKMFDRENIIIENDLKLKIKLFYPVKKDNLFYYLHMCDYGILHSSQYNKLGDLTVDDWLEATSGPYYLKKSNNEYFLKANPYARSNNIDEIHCKDYDNPKEILNDIRTRNLHFGAIYYREFSEIYESIKTIPHANLTDTSFDSVIILIINIKSKLFQDIDTRQCVHKKILDNLYFNGSGIQKADQYFLPGSKGYIPNSELQTLLKIDHLPSSLIDGFEIITRPSLEKYMPYLLLEKLQNALDLPVQIIIEDSSTYLKKRDQRSFDAALFVTSMSFENISESLNLLYDSYDPTFSDPTGKIKKYLQEFKVSGDIKIIKEITKQMVIDSECIPLAYIVKPIYYDKSLDISKINLFDSPYQLWKCNVREE